MSPPPPPDAAAQLKTIIRDFKADRYKLILATDEFREFNISLRDWSKLRDEFDLDEDESFPRYSFDASRSILTLQGPPSSIHEAIVRFLDQSLNRVISPAAAVEVATAHHIEHTSRRYEGSVKVPDLAIIQEGSNGFWEVKWVLEVGFAETYQKLKKDMKLILNGARDEKLQCALVKIKETPSYRCPVSKKEKIRQEDWKGPEEITSNDIVGETELGPYRYGDRQWMGKISEIFWETWKFDVKTNKVKQIGDRQVIHPASPSQPLPHIPLDEILPNSATGPLLLDWNTFQAKLKVNVITLARQRYGEWYQNHWKDESDDDESDDEDQDESDDSKDEDYVDEEEKGIGTSALPDR